ncbi:MAG: PQQ-dependent sugar dehydrogenase [Chloroflexota bacterium]
MKFKAALTLIAGLLLFGLFASPSFVAQAVDFVPVGFSEALVAQGLKTPTNMAIAPDGRIFVLEQQTVTLSGGATEGRGYVRVVKNGALLPTPFVTINNIDLRGEHGLVGLVFDPNYTVNGYLYLFFTKPTTPSLAAHNEVWRYTASPPSSDVAQTNSGIRVIQFPSIINTVHIGGSMHFSPLDGKLYIGIGDDLTGGDRAQHVNDFRGRFMRYTINPDGTYDAPADNPWYSTADNTISKGTFAMGFRNPYQFAIQPGTGRIFANEVGESTYEEIDQVQSGKHYGWKFCEGPCNPTNVLYTNPIFYYTHGKTANNQGCAITGGTFYNPTNANFPAAYTGKYFFNDYCNNWIRYIDPASPSTSTLFATNLYPSTVAMAVSANGSLYYLARGTSSSDGRLLRIDYAPSAAPTFSDPPTSKTVTAGQKATFTCSAAGASPIAYQWQRQSPGAADFVNISGATGTSYTTPVTTIAGDNGARYRCQGTNANGSSFSPYAVLTVVLNQPPTVSISVKINGSTARRTWLLGDTVSFTITATDAVDGAIPNSSLTWSVDLIHEPPLSGIHIHPILPVTSGTNIGSFDIAEMPHDLAHLSYRINVRATDSGGLYTDAYKIVESSLIAPIYNSAVTSVNPVLSWQRIPGAIGYEVYFGLTDTPTTHFSVPSTTPYFTLPVTMTLIPMENYYWYVKVLYSGGASTGTDTWRFHVDSAATSAPLRNYFTGAQPTFTWSRIVFASGYRIQISTHPSFLAGTIVYDTTVSGNTTLSHHVTSALPEGVYYWRVAPLRADSSTGYFSPGQVFTVKLS